jgi:predicted nucleic acid-binding protein
VRYVLDSCVAVKWFLAEPDSPKAVQLLDEYNRQMHDLLAPNVFPVEVAHALTRAERRGLIQPIEGSQYLSDLLAYLPTLHSSLTLLPRAYEISSQARIGVYDCLYVALAEREGCNLLTADARLLNALSPAYSFIASLASLP